MPDFRVGKPRCRLRRTTDVAMAAGTQTIVWQVADYDDVSGWDGSSGYTVDRGGLYAVAIRAGRLAIAASASLIIGPAVNGVDQPFTRVGPGVTGAVGGATWDLLELDTGDVVTARANGTGASGWSIQAIYTAMHIVRLGPVAWT